MPVDNSVDDTDRKQEQHLRDEHGDDVDEHPEDRPDTLVFEKNAPEHRAAVWRARRASLPVLEQRRMQTGISKTELNLWTAFMDEAKTHRLYSAYALQAMSEGFPEAAEAFMEAAGDEIVHALMHLRALGVVKTTAENLRQVVEHEANETQITYPRYIAEAKAEGRGDALEGFQVAMAREQHHVKLFEDALATVEEKSNRDAAAGRTRPPSTFDRAPVAKRTAAGVEKMSGPAEVTEERERMRSGPALAAFVFGAH